MKPDRSSPDAAKVACLIRVFRSAVASGDEVLRSAVSKELKRFGIFPGDLAVSQATNTSCDELSSDGREASHE